MPNRLVAVVALVVALVFALLAADPAAARRKKRRARNAVLTVVVLPFTGKGSGGTDAKDALELELELVDQTQVTESDVVEEDLRRAGRRAWDSEVLAGILARRKVDVLIRGERGPGARSPDALLVTAWSTDGKPRFFKELALGTEPDVAAASIVGALRPALDDWRSLRPIKLPGADLEEEAPAPRGERLRPEDVLVDEDIEDERVAEDRRAADRDGGRDADGARGRGVLDEDDVKPRPEKHEPAQADSRTERRRSPLDFNDSGDDDEPPPKKKRRSLFDEEPADEDRPADVDENGRRRQELDDIDASAKEAPASPRAHRFAVSGGFEGGSWFYSFDGGGTGDNSVPAPFYPGGGAAIDVWPLSFARVDWLGLDADVAISAVPFRIDTKGLDFTPVEFVSIQTRAGATLKLRYTFKNALGIGVRAGYRYVGATVETQTVTVNGQRANLTAVPGYTLHAAALGVEGMLPLVVIDHRLELELRADALPATYYEEAPDNPGATSLGYGWSASLAARFDVGAGFFVEARGHSTGVRVQYSNPGQRLALIQARRLVQLQGGSVLNVTAGFGLHVGFLW